MESNILHLKTQAQGALSDLLKHGAQQLLLKAIEKELAEPSGQLFRPPPGGQTGRRAQWFFA